MRPQLGSFLSSLFSIAGVPGGRASKLSRAGVYRWLLLMRAESRWLLGVAGFDMGFGI